MTRVYVSIYVERELYLYISVRIYIYVRFILEQFGCWKKAMQLFWLLSIETEQYESIKIS